jgi:hypothetical protein
MATPKSTPPTHGGTLDSINLPIPTSKSLSFNRSVCVRAGSIEFCIDYKVLIQPFRSIPDEINRRSQTHLVTGGCKSFDKGAKGLSRNPNSDIFGPRTVFRKYAFPNGGCTEIQFNFAFEEHRLIFDTCEKFSPRREPLLRYTRALIHARE